MSDNTLYIRALVRAAKLLGSVEALARHLGVSQTRLKLYLQGGERVPEALFLRTVDVLVDDETGKLGKELVAQGKGGNAKRNGNRNGKG